jgi:outer membrane protein OmpA-like peptidoglycan-associated protein
MKKIYFAFAFLLMTVIANSQNVQWASKVVAYSTQFSSTKYSANQVLGKPNSMPQGDDSPCAWAPSTKGGKKEFVKVSYDKPMKIKQVIIAENYNAGMILKVNLYDANGKKKTVYKSKPFKVVAEKGRMLSIKLEQETEFEVVQVEVILSLAIANVFASIDAIGISATTDEYVPKPYTTADVNFVSKKENLGKQVNSTYTELLPVISPDGNTLYFVRDEHPQNKGSQDIWYCTKNADGSWTDAQNMGSPLNNEKANFVASVTPDGNKVLLGGVYQKDGGKGVSFSTKNSRGFWNSPTKVDVKNYYNKNDYNEFCMSNSSKYILMTVERDDTYGSKDVYVSVLQSDGSYSEPKNLGPMVNTAAKETSPFLAGDEKTLYYSTSGFSTYGDNDIFMTKRLDDTWTNWSEPVNLGSQVNTPNWDAYYTISSSGDYAYFVSSENSIGNEDIFRMKLPEEVKPDPVVLVSGKVINAKTNEPIAANIVYQLLPSGKEMGTAVSNGADGYKIILPFGNNYSFNASAVGYIAVNENMDLTNLKEYKEIKKDLYLVPIEVGQTVRLNNIFFETGKADLLPASFVELDNLVKILTDNPNIEIEIEGHTDNVGSDASNLTLSKNRSKSVYDYLVSKGVNAERLKSNGYGKSKPIATNDTDEGKAQNRRVQFTILKK